MARTAYATDLTDGQWEKIDALLPAAKGGRTGRPRTYAKRDIFDAIFYRLRTGCSWEMLPHEFPPHESVRFHYRRWRDDGTIQKVHDALRGQVRVAAGKEPTPSAAVIDSGGEACRGQSVKTTEKGGPVGTTRARKLKAVSVTSSWTRWA